MPAKKRRLSDLYVRGRELEVNDGEGEPIKVWLAKLNEIDREAATRRANAAKARFLIDSDNEESESFQEAYGQVRMIETGEELIAFLVADDIVKFRRRVEAERSLDEETWAKDGYLQGLYDAWLGDDDNPGLSSVIAEDPNDPEATRVDRELKRFEQEIVDETEAEYQRLKKDFESLSFEDLRRKAAHKLLELRGTEQFMREYRRQALFFAVRDPVQRRMRYFQNVSEVDDLEDELRLFLQNQYEALEVGPEEGKDSPSAESSSSSSETAEPETPQASGPEAAVA